MSDLLRYVRVQFVDDENVKFNLYWYLSDIDVKIGDRVVAPLGRHNHRQIGIVRAIEYVNEYNTPFPLYLTKYIVRLAGKEEKDVSDN